MNCKCFKKWWPFIPQGSKPNSAVHIFRFLYGIVIREDGVFLEGFEFLTWIKLGQCPPRPFPKNDP